MDASSKTRNPEDEWPIISFSLRFLVSSITGTSVNKVSKITKWDFMINESLVPVHVFDHLFTQPGGTLLTFGLFILPPGLYDLEDERPRVTGIWISGRSHARSFPLQFRHYQSLSRRANRCEEDEGMRTRMSERWSSSLDPFSLHRNSSLLFSVLPWGNCEARRKNTRWDYIPERSEEDTALTAHLSQSIINS